jgi:hypothetical protein
MVGCFCQCIEFKLIWQLVPTTHNTTTVVQHVDTQEILSHVECQEPCHSTPSTHQLTLATIYSKCGQSFGSIFPNGSHAYVQNNPGLFLDQAPVNDVETCGNGVVDADEECDTLNNDCCLPGCLEAKEENTPCNGERVGTGEHPLCVKYLCQSATCTRLVAKAPKLKTGTTGKITITGVKCSAVSKSLLGRNVVNPNFVNITKAVKKAADGNTAIGVRKIVFCNGAGVCNQNCRLSKPYPPTLGC